MEPTTQGDDVEVTVDESQVNAGADDKSGIQKRIDELTAMAREAERQNVQKDAYIQQLLAAVANKQVESTREPDVEIDDEERKKFEAMAAPFFSKIEKALESINMQTGEMKLHQDPLYGRVKPEVKNRASELQHFWAKRGINMTPNEALNLALGEHARKDLEAGANASASRTAFNNSGGVITSRSAPNAGISNEKVATPADIQKWPADKQIEWFKKHRGDMAF